MHKPGVNSIPDRAGRQTPERPRTAHQLEERNSQQWLSMPSPHQTYRSHQVSCAATLQRIYRDPETPSQPDFRPCIGKQPDTQELPANPHSFGPALYISEYVERFARPLLLSPIAAWEVKPRPPSSGLPLARLQLIGEALGKTEITRGGLLENACKASPNS